MAMEWVRIIIQNAALYIRALSGLLISLPLILKIVYTWGKIMRDREYKDVISKMKEISEENKKLK